MPDPDPTDEQTPETPADNPTETAEAATGEQTEQTPTEQAEAAQEPEEKESEQETKLSHEDAISALTDVRKEAANWRTKFRDLEAKYANAKTPEEVEAIQAETREASATEARALLIENVGLAAGIPKEHHHRLVGATREELEADAKSLSALLPAQQVDDPDLSGGLTPHEGDSTYDAEAALKRVRAMRRGR